MTTVSEREVLAITAALLDQGKRIDWISRALIVTALAALAAFGVFDVNKPGTAVLLASSALIGVAELYLAIRVGFDAALFRRMADAPEAPDFAKLDGALTMLGLLAAGKAGRPLGQRTSGTCRLFRYQTGLAAAQIILFLVGAALAMLH
jgi:hypothetical protein